MQKQPTKVNVILLPEPVAAQVIDYIETHVHRPMKEVKQVVGAIVQARRVDQAVMNSLLELSDKPSDDAQPNGDGTKVENPSDETQEEDTTTH